MTRRERLERKLNLRRDWAVKAGARSEARFATARRIGSFIPFGQPILVGHHSERRARRDAERITSNMGKGVEESRLASHHTSCASGLERQLERSVFSDDPDAVEALQAKIAEAEASNAKMKELNKAWRKGGVEAVRATFGDKLANAAESVMRTAPWLKAPFSTTNGAANIRRMKARVEDIKRRQARTAKAEEAGVLIEGVGDYVRVTFPEKPAREVLEALRAADFRWGGGSWTGRRDKLPECVNETLSVLTVSHESNITNP